MAYELPALSYAYDALEPHIDARTMEIHHTKHHQTYINTLNGALESHPDLAAKSVEDLVSDLDAVPEGIRGAVQNHGGGNDGKGRQQREVQAQPIVDDNQRHGLADNGDPADPGEGTQADGARRGRLVGAS